MVRLICTDCGNTLTDEERHYYGSRCERCEREWSDRIEGWRRGAEDTDLDRRYDGKPPIRH